MCCMSEPINSEDPLEFDQADRLRRALRISNTTVQEMAEELAVERNTVGRYINGRTRPNRSTLVVWAMRTGVPVAWLETGVTCQYPLADPSCDGLDSGRSAVVLRLLGGSPRPGVATLPRPGRLVDLAAYRARRASSSRRARHQETA